MKIKNTMNYDQNDCKQFSFITPLFSDTCKQTLKAKVGDVVGSSVVFSR
jgi:hypothetical protein